MTPEYFMIGGLILVCLGGLLCHGAAYRNGVTDGYGYSKEPNCPGYRRAGEYLRRMMKHRWHELGECGIKHGFGDQTCIRERGHEGLCRSKPSNGTFSEWQSRNNKFRSHSGYYTVADCNQKKSCIAQPVKAE